MIKDAYIAIKTSDQNVEIGTNRLQKYGSSNTFFPSFSDR